MLIGSVYWNHQLALDKKLKKKGTEDQSSDARKQRINANDFPVVGKRLITKKDDDDAIVLSYVGEGWYRFLFTHGCLNIYPTEGIDFGVDYYPGAVNSTLNQFAKPVGDEEDPNWVPVPAKTCTRHNNVRHVRACFFYAATMLNGTGTLPHSEEKTAYGHVTLQTSRNSNANVNANAAKMENFNQIEAKIKYNMYLIHKSAMACKYSFSVITLR